MQLAIPTAEENESSDKSAPLHPEAIAAKYNSENSSD